MNVREREREERERERYCRAAWESGEEWTELRKKAALRRREGATATHRKNRRAGRGSVEPLRNTQNTGRTGFSAGALSAGAVRCWRPSCLPLWLT